MQRIPGQLSAWLFLLLVGGSARAQDSGEDPAAGATEEPAPPDAPGAPPVVGSLDPIDPPYAEGWRWVRRSPVRGRAVADVAVHPANPDRVAAIDTDGQIWVSTDGGRIWNLAFGQSDEGLGPLSNDEDILRDIDARLGEILDDNVDLSDTSDEEVIDEDEVADAISDAAAQGGSEILTDIEADPGFVLGDPDSGTPMDPRIVYVGSELFASVGGTLYLSVDGGRSFGEVLDVHVFDVVALSSMRIALTEDGARVALDPRAWFDIQDGTEGRALIDGDRSDEVLLAASADGLWSTRDGQTWTRWGELRGEVRALAINAEEPETVWAVTPAGLRRSDDRGLTFGQPLVRGVVDDVAAPIAGRVIVTRPGTVLESNDRGLSWQPATKGLTGLQDGRLTARPGGGVLMAAADGLYSLERYRDDEEASTRSEWVGLLDLLNATITRQAVRQDFNSFRRRYQSVAFPTLQTDVIYQPPGVYRDWSGPQGTNAEEKPYWYARIRLTWTPRQTRSSSLDYVDPAEIDAGVVVVDGEPLLLTGTDDYVVAARLERNTLGYQAELATTVTDLYRTRAELVAERPRLRDTKLQRRVHHELAIAELEARLDALTEGAVSRWAGRQTTQEL